MQRATALAWLCLALAPPASAQEAAPPTAPVTDPTQVRPGRYVLDPAHGRITWSLSHFGYSTYYGQITGVAAALDLDPRTPAQSRVTARIGAEGFDALDAELNRTLRGPDFLDAVRFPAATFASRVVEPTGPTTARIQGDLDLRGVTRPVVVDATFTQAGLHPLDRRYTVGFEGRAVLRRSEFGLGAFLPALGDEVTLRIEGEFKAEAP
ncbi:Protein YceI [Methylobacterium crusticola]|uniref:Protein YceI n=1 Tax=Methylobacterium crusticola TaxID=1697972 RepID=A0ABQ4R0L7_9HYPH|nr:YceI family protein [Methylobacterium crusticola]GJD51148.1 Protein YceI [Methylobacterium crusticola]